MPEQSRTDEPEDQPVFDFWGMHPVVLIFVLLYVIGVLLVASGNVATLDISFVLLGLGFLSGWYVARNYVRPLRGSQTMAFVICVVFPVIGFVCYWIYSKVFLPHQGPAPRE